METEKVLEFLGSEYQLAQLFVEPSDAGHAGVARPRTYAFYYNTTKLEYKHDIFQLYHAVTHEIGKVCATRPEDYLISTENARDLDMMAFAQKRHVEFQKVPCIDNLNLHWFISMIILDKFSPLSFIRVFSSR